MIAGFTTWQSRYTYIINIHTLVLTFECFNTLGLLQSHATQFECLNHLPSYCPVLMSFVNYITDTLYYDSGNQVV